MNWDRRLRVSRSLTLQVDPGGGLVAANSISRPPQKVEFDAVPVLLAFAAPATPGEALERLQAEWEVEKADFAAVVERLVEGNLLTPAAAAGADGGAHLAAGGFAGVMAHHHLLCDALRVGAYREAIRRHCPGKRVVEIGCGSGILSILAARAGARSVVAIEESAIADLAAEMFAANGCADVVELVRGNSRDVDLEEPAEVLIHELLGVDPLVENLLPAIEDGRRRLLVPGGRLIPHRLEILCVGFEVTADPEDGRAALLAEAAELSGLYGLDFSPYLARLRALPATAFGRRPETRPGARFEPAILTEPLGLLDLDFTGDLGGGLGALETGAGDLRLRAVRSGGLGGVAIYFRAHLDERTVLSNSPFLPPTHWGYHTSPLSRRVAVAPGDEIALSAELVTRRGKQALDVDLAAGAG